MMAKSVDQHHRSFVPGLHCMSGLHSSSSSVHVLKCNAEALHMLRCAQGQHFNNGRAAL